MFLKDNDLDFTHLTEGSIEEIIQKAYRELMNDGESGMPLELDPALTWDADIFHVPTDLPGLTTLHNTPTTKKLSPRQETLKRKKRDLNDDEDDSSLRAKHFQKQEDHLSIANQIPIEVIQLLSRNQLKFDTFHRLLGTGIYKALIASGFSQHSIISILSQLCGSKNITLLASHVIEEKLSLFYNFGFDNDQLSMILAQPLGYENIRLLQQFLENQNTEDIPTLNDMNNAGITPAHITSILAQPLGYKNFKKLIASWTVKKFELGSFYALQAAGLSTAEIVQILSQPKGFDSFNAIACLVSITKINILQIKQAPEKIAFKTLVLKSHATSRVKIALKILASGLSINPACLFTHLNQYQNHDALAHLETMPLEKLTAYIERNFKQETNPKLDDTTNSEASFQPKRTKLSPLQFSNKTPYKNQLPAASEPESSPESSSESSPESSPESSSESSPASSPEPFEDAKLNIDIDSLFAVSSTDKTLPKPNALLPKTFEKIPTAIIHALQDYPQKQEALQDFFCPATSENPTLRSLKLKEIVMIVKPIDGANHLRFLKELTQPTGTKQPSSLEQLLHIGFRFQDIITVLTHHSGIHCIEAWLLLIPLVNKDLSEEKTPQFLDNLLTREPEGSKYFSNTSALYWILQHPIAQEIFGKYLENEFFTHALLKHPEFSNALLTPIMPSASMSHYNSGLLALTSSSIFSKILLNEAFTHSLELPSFFKRLLQTLIAKIPHDAGENNNISALYYLANHPDGITFLKKLFTYTYFKNQLRKPDFFISFLDALIARRPDDLGKFANTSALYLLSQNKDGIELLEKILDNDLFKKQLKESAFFKDFFDALLTKAHPTPKAKTSLAVLFNIIGYSDAQAFLQNIVKTTEFQEQQKKPTFFNTFIKTLFEKKNENLGQFANLSVLVLGQTLLKFIDTLFRFGDPRKNLEHDAFFQELSFNIQWLESLRINRIQNDPELLALCNNPHYEFSKIDLKNLTHQEYYLIKRYPATHLFLLAGFRVTELDPPKMQRTISSMKHFTLHEVNGIIELAIQTKKHIGLKKYKQLLGYCYKENNLYLKHLPSILRSTTNIPSEAKESLSIFLSDLESNKPWESISDNLLELQIHAFDEKNRSIPIQTVFDSYRTVSSDVQAAFMPDESSLERSIQLFKKTEQKTTRFRQENEEQLTNSLREALDQYTSRDQALAEQLDNDILDEAESTIWAILREQFYRCYKIFPYSTQMINAHLILNTPNRKTIGQIKTGEGKSALQALMMVFNAITTKRKQFNVTTANHLAERDMNKFKRFYSMFNLTCSANVSSRQELNSLYDNPEVYNANIIYGTMASFSFGYLSTLNGVQSLEQYFFNLHHADVFVDEVDALLLDDNRATPRLIRTHPNQKTNNNKLYKAISTYINTYMTPNNTTHSLDHFRATLIAQKFLTEADMQKKERLLETWQWYQSAQTSLSIHLNCQYILRETADQRKPTKEVIIVDKSTGEFRHGRKWSHGLHEIISIRHGISLPPNTQLTSTIAPHNLLSLFGSIFSITGTAGGDACTEYLQKVYSGITIMHLPRYRPSQSYMVEHIISDNKTAQYDQLIKDIQLAQKKGQPLLLLFDTIRQVLEFSAYAKSKKCPVIQLTGLEQNPIENTLAIAGLPGKVLVSTFLAGRGADITPSPDAEENGGLGVYLCTPPANNRVKWQNFGRTGRQGRAGFYAYRFNKETLMRHISRLEQSISDNQQLIGEENPDTQLSIRDWEKPYNRVELSAIQTELQSLAPTVSPPESLSKQKAITPTSTETLTTPTADTLLEKWETLLEEAEKLANNANINYARYIDRIFYFQKFAYDTHDKLIIDSFIDFYEFIMNDLEYAFYEKKINAFEKIIGQCLIQIGKDTDKNIWTIEKLRAHATETNNTLMLLCLNRAAPLENPQAISESSSAFFAAPTHNAPKATCANAPKAPGPSQ